MKEISVLTEESLTFSFKYAIFKVSFLKIKKSRAHINSHGVNFQLDVAYEIGVRVMKKVLQLVVN